jgi:hypothetical protein
MEDIGQINNYRCKECGSSTITINLNVGTTPFMIKCPHCGAIEASSCFYRIDRVATRIEVTHCWYRPTKDYLREHPEIKEHILNGGLIMAPIGTVPIVPDDVKVDWKYNQWQKFARATYDDNPMLTDIIEEIRKDDESRSTRETT